MFDKLFTPITIKDMTLRNRIIMPAMGTRFTEDRFVNDKHIAYHVARARGGSALNIVEVSSVHALSAPKMFLSIAEDKYIPKMKELTDAIHARMREAIDQACEDASTAEDFHRALYRQGYIFGSDPNRKYATIRAWDDGRAVRLYRLGEEYDLAVIDNRLRGNYLLYGPRLYALNHPPRQNTPKRYRPKNNYTGKSILQIFFEVFFGESQMHRLYLYYCYQLGILPKKQQPHINRPELERIWKDTERILAEHAFVYDHKFPSLQAIVDYRKSLS